MADANGVPLQQLNVVSVGNETLTQAGFDDEISASIDGPDEVRVDSTQGTQTQVNTAVKSSKSRWTSGRIGTAAGCVALILAIPALVLQLYGIAISKQTLEEQIWKDCRDREDMKFLEMCKSLPSTPFSALRPRETDLVFHIAKPVCSHPIFWCEGVTSARPAEDGHNWAKPIFSGGPDFIQILNQIWYWVKTLSTNVFLGLVVIHIIFLWPLRDVRLFHRQRHKGNGNVGYSRRVSARTSHQDTHLSIRELTQTVVGSEMSPSSYPSSEMSNPVERGFDATAVQYHPTHLEESMIHASTHNRARSDKIAWISGLILPFLSLSFLLSAGVGLRTGYVGDLACGAVLIFLTVLFYVFEPLIQHTRSPLAPRKSIVAQSRDIVLLRWL